MSSNEEKDYEVGYRKPPVETRFRKGQSGNPSGRPKRVSEELDPGMILQCIDSEEITLSINGKPARMTKAEIEFRQLFSKAIRGDMSAARLIANMATRYFAPEARSDSENEYLSETEVAERYGPKWRQLLGVEK
jgi:hypothetical protein